MFFEFDENKSKINKQKHNIDFYEAQKIWDDTTFQITTLHHITSTGAAGRLKGQPRTTHHLKHWSFSNLWAYALNNSPLKSLIVNSISPSLIHHSNI